MANAPIYTDYLKRYLNDPDTIQPPQTTPTTEQPTQESNLTTYMRRYLNDPTNA